MRLTPRAAPLALGCVLVSCGSRTALDALVEPSLRGGADAAVVLDARVDSVEDAAPEAAPDAAPDAGSCQEGLNTMYPTVAGGGPTDVWFASPYTPATDISVTRIETHTLSGSVGLLASAGGAPGAVLFSGSVGTSASPTWLGANVSPPIHLDGGALYYLAFQDAYCSFATGPEAPEYFSSSVSGPWMQEGTDTWTARVIGVCSP